MTRGLRKVSVPRVMLLGMSVVGVYCGVGLLFTLYCGLWHWVIKPSLAPLRSIFCRCVWNTGPYGANGTPAFLIDRVIIWYVTLILVWVVEREWGLPRRGSMWRFVPLLVVMYGVAYMICPFVPVP